MRNRDSRVVRVAVHGNYRGLRVSIFLVVIDEGERMEKKENVLGEFLGNLKGPYAGFLGKNKMRASVFDRRVGGY